MQRTLIIGDKDRQSAWHGAACHILQDLSRMHQSRVVSTPNTGEDTEQRTSPSLLKELQSRMAISEDTFAVFYKTKIVSPFDVATAWSVHKVIEKLCQ